MTNRRIITALAVGSALAGDVLLFAPFDKRETTNRSTGPRPVLVQVTELKKGVVRDRTEAVGTARAARTRTLLASKRNLNTHEKGEETAKEIY